jgi:phosphonate transport system substrate-binding protein
LAVRNGSTSYHAALFTAAESSIASVADLEGVRAAWVDRQSASGYVFIRAALRRRGLSLVDAFKEDQFLRSHADVARAVLECRADVGATYCDYHPGTRDLADAGWRAVGADSAVRILLEAGPIPSDFFAVHPGMDARESALLEAAIVDARPALVHRLAKELVGADAFVRPSAGHLAMLREMVQRLGPASRPGGASQAHTPGPRSRR